MLDYQKVSKRDREEAEAIFSTASNLDKIYQTEKTQQTEVTGLTQISA